MLQLRQDTRALPGLVELGVAELARLTLRGLVNPAGVDHLLCHYSSEHFRPEIHKLLEAAGLAIPRERWFTNLSTKGNTGAASIFVMLEECWRTGRFRPGDRILLMVPESGRFTVAFAHLTCVAGHGGALPTRATVAARPDPPPTTSSPLGEPGADDGEVARWLLLELALVWADFERRLRSVELVRRIEQREVTLGEYQRLLVNLRQQVVDGGRWIARAASSMSADLFPLRSAFILHAGEEHRDYQMLEADFLAVGGLLEEIHGTPKNVGSEALSAFIFHQASQPDPIDLLGAMFVIEGLGAAKALHWAELLQVLPHRRGVPARGALPAARRDAARPPRRAHRRRDIPHLATGRLHGPAAHGPRRPAGVYAHAIICEYAHARLYELRDQRRAVSAGPPV
jgi:3-oxoacyl-[acyl-carrier-protein] synthase-3